MRNRRDFIKTTVGGALAIPVATLLASRRALAAEMPQLDPSNAVAAALSYTHDATSSGRASDDQMCSACLQFTGDEGAEWGPCNIFPDNVVAAAGWCAAFVPKG